MNPNRTTPVPNELFDVFLKDLKVTELKILLIIIRQTLGWVNKQVSSGRKSRDWISTSQLERKTGASRRAISSALAGLVEMELIRITDDNGSYLNDAIQRKGKFRLFYQLQFNKNMAVDNLGKICLHPEVKCIPGAEIAQDISKNIQHLAQKMRITKETLQN